MDDVFFDKKQVPEPEGEQLGNCPLCFCSVIERNVFEMIEQN